MEELKNKYYIRIDERGRVVKVFSDIFDKVKESDILIGEGFGSQYRADSSVLSDELQDYADVENGLDLIDENGLYILKYENGIICKVSDEEIEEEIGDLPEPEPSELEQIKSQNTELKNNVLTLETLSLIIMEGLTEVYEKGTYQGVVKENIIVELYVKLILNDKRTIDDVPEDLRTQVEERLGEIFG